jgi:hypothetical protein
VTGTALTLDRAIAVARQLPPEAQDEIARELLIFAGEDVGPVPLTAEEEAWLAPSLAQAARGEFASDEEVAALLAKHGAKHGA